MNINTNPYKFIAIPEAVKIHCSFLCVKDDNGNYIMTDEKMLIECCKTHVRLLDKKDKQYEAMLLFYFDNIKLLYELKNCETSVVLNTCDHDITPSSPRSGSPMVCSKCGYTHEGRYIFN